MKQHDRRVRSHLFTLRLWSETVDQGRTELRGKVQHALDGEVRYFRDWDSLVASLVSMLPEQGSASVEVVDNAD